MNTLVNTCDPGLTHTGFPASESPSIFKTGAETPSTKPALQKLKDIATDTSAMAKSYASVFFSNENWDRTNTTDFVISPPQTSDVIDVSTDYTSLNVSPPGTSDIVDILVGSCLDRVQDRLAYLEAVIDEEGSVYSSKSGQALISFIKNNKITQKPLISALDSGNLSAKWAGDNGERIVINFLGGQEVKFVLFATRAASQNLAIIHGIDVFEGLHKNIHANDLSHLL